MTFWRLITRGLRFYWRNHIGVMLCIAISTAVILGALVVGDSIRYSLKKIALSRLGEIQLALASQDHYFRTELANELETELGSNAVSAILLGGIAINNENNLRANNIQVFGIDEKFWKLGNIDVNLKDEDAIINERLAKQLGVKNSEEILIKVEKTSLLPLDAPLSVDTDLSASLRVTIKEIMPDLSIGGFSLQTNQIAPFNVFVPIQRLQEKIDLKGKANLLLIGDNKNNKVFKSPLIPLSKGGNLGADLSKRENLSEDLSKGENLSDAFSKGGDLKAPLEKGGRGDFDANIANSALKKQWQLADIGLELNPIPELGMSQLTTKRIFIDQPIESVMKEISPDYIGVLTYLVNEIRLGDLSTPYSMLSAIDPKAIMPNLKDDEIVINQWLADDIEAKVGDRIKLSYFVFDNQRRLYEKSTEFRITAIVPISGIFADKTLMPEFPGLANVESSRDWEPGIPIDLSKIRNKDEDYWHKYRGTPKGFITLKAGQAIWGNRFGSLTAIRYPLNANTIKIDSMIKSKLDPESVGLSFQTIRERAILSSKPTTDFGQLFFGLSIFLIFSSCLLAGLVFVFGVQQRREEIGTLLAIGFKAKQIRRLFLAEGFFIALCGGILGIVLGIAYTKAVLFALSNIWQNAVSATNLQYHAEPLTLLGGLFAGIGISMITIRLVFRRQSKHTARELLSNDFASSSRGEAFAYKKYPVSNASQGKCFTPTKRGNRLSLWIAIILFVISAILILITGADRNRATNFFGVGALMLIGFFALSNFVLQNLARSKGAKRLTISKISFRNVARRKGRSLAIISLLACGSFLIIAIGANKQNAMENFDKRSSGTGGFAFYAETTLPILYNLNDDDKRKFGIMGTDTRFVQFRVHDGDDASCLNLNRVQSPRILGVNPDELQKRGAFRFMKSISNDGFGMLSENSDERVINAIGDDATITWSLGLSVGDTMPYIDEQGQPFKIKIVGSLANSIFQGVFIISERNFLKLFPSESGYRVFLIDAPFNNIADISKTLSGAFQDFGMELTPAYIRLAEFNAVQNTYLSIFQMLGGLALILGSVGLGMVVLRNVMERRRELALLRTIGYSKRLLQRLILSEHWALLLIGEIFGAVTSLIAVLPVTIAQGSDMPYLSLSITLTAVFVSGLIWIWLATRLALRGEMLSALREE